VWAATEVEYGGLGWTSNDIGEAMTGMGVLMMAIQIALYPMLERRFGCKTILMGTLLGAAATIVAYPLLPRLLHLTTAGNGSEEGQQGQRLRATMMEMACVTALSGVARVFIGMSFTSVSILINNCVASEARGTLNGLALATTGATRSFAPLFSGSLLAWSITPRQHARALPFPLDVHLSFIVMAAFLVLTAWIATRLPERLNSQHKS